MILIELIYNVNIDINRININASIYSSNEYNMSYNTILKC